MPSKLIARPKWPLTADNDLMMVTRGTLGEIKVLLEAPGATYVKSTLDEITEVLVASAPAATVKALRDAGWRVAVHNDYMQGDTLWTFWLFTHPSGRWIKGEDTTDGGALQQCIEQSRSHG